MKLVEFTNSPPAFEIANVAGHQVIRFYCNVSTVDREGQDCYITECYEMQTNRSANLQDRIEKNYDSWLKKAKELDGGLELLKHEKIALSKSMLSDYISSHPLTSNAHGGVPGVYSVTEEKQSLMTSQYISYQAEKSINPDAVLTWNETGRSCEIWTEEEFLQLIVEIKQYVYPLVSHQQKLEEEIAAATSIQDLESIVIDYGTVSPNTKVPSPLLRRRTGLLFY